MSRQQRIVHGPKKLSKLNYIFQSKHNSHHSGINSDIVGMDNRCDRKHYSPQMAVILYLYITQKHTIINGLHETHKKLVIEENGLLTNPCLSEMLLVNFSL